MKKNIVIIMVVVALIIVGALAVRFIIGGDEDTWICDNSRWVKHGNPADPQPTKPCENDTTGANTAVQQNCSVDTDCETPVEYLIQSRCPFDSACINNYCEVVCPFNTPDPNINISQSYPIACSQDNDCDCQDYLGDDMKACQCVDGGCMVIIQTGVATDDTKSTIDQFNWSTMNQGPYRDSVTYATSSDLLNWVSSDQILATHASVPGAVIKDNIIFAYFVDVSKDGVKEQLGMIKSTDQGQTWSQPITLTIEGLGDKATADPDPVLLSDGRIRLYYFDINEPRLIKPANGIEPANKIYSAISDDGINFTQEDGVRFARQGIFDPDVNLFDGTWYLYGGDIEGNQVIYATSTDGLTFFEGGVVYNGGAVPDVFYDNQTYYLFTAGIGIATGDTPIFFINTKNNFIDSNSQGATADPSVIKLNNGTYIMLYKIQ